MAHIIEYKDIINEDGDNIIESTLASSYGKGVDKKIVIEVDIGVLSSTFVVYDKREVVYKGSNSDVAIAHYNEIGN